MNMKTAAAAAETVSISSLMQFNARFHADFKRMIRSRTLRELIMLLFDMINVNKYKIN
jgi:hypothetical protein